MTEIRIESFPVALDGAAAKVLVRLGVPGDLAELWGLAGGRRAGCLWRATDASGSVVVWEAHRRIASQRTICGWSCVSRALGQDSAAVSALLAAAVGSIIDEAQASGAAAVKVQVAGAGSVLAAVAADLGFHALPTPDLAASPMAAEAGPPVAGWIRVLEPGGGCGVLFEGCPAYERQQSDFTCGPATVIMALSGSDVAVDGGFGAEMSMWREATYTYGCGHYGVAGLIGRAGAGVEVLASREGPIVGLAAPHAMVNAHLRQQIHTEHRAGALRAGAHERIGGVELADLHAALAAGKRVALLVDLMDLNGEDVPHWILVWGRVGGALLVHDPWFDEEFGETWVETAYMPVDADDLWAVADWAESRDEGAVRDRAALVIGL